MKAIVIRRYGSGEAATIPLAALTALQALKDWSNIKSG